MFSNVSCCASNGSRPPCTPGTADVGDGLRFYLPPTGTPPPGGWRRIELSANDFDRSRSTDGARRPRAEQRRGGASSRNVSAPSRRGDAEQPRCWPSRRRPRHAEHAGWQGLSTRVVGVQRRNNGGANNRLTERVDSQVRESGGQSGRVGISSRTGSDVEQTFTFTKRSSIAKQRRWLGAEPSDVGETVMAISVCGGTQ